MKPIEQDNHLDNEKQLKSRRNFKRILVFVLLNVVSIALVIIFTKNDQTFGALLSIKPQFLLLTAAIWFCSISCDSIGMIFFVRGTGEKVKLGESYKLSLIRIFFQCHHSFFCRRPAFYGLYVNPNGHFCRKEFFHYNYQVNIPDALFLPGCHLFLFLFRKRNQQYSGIKLGISGNSHFNYCLFRHRGCRTALPGFYDPDYRSGKQASGTVPYY